MARKIGIPNILALARRDKIMTFMKPPSGRVLVSSDGTAMEPTITSALSGDKLYTYAAIDGIGKPLYFQGDILMIPDLYLMLTSISPVGGPILRQHIESVGGITKFSGMYLTDSDKAVKPLKNIRTLHKVMALMIGYGGMPKRIHSNLTEAGFDVTLSQCQHIFDLYWELFSDVAKFKKQCERFVKRNGYIINPMGYRCTPDVKDAFNYMIQSSVNPIISTQESHLFKLNQSFQFVSRIHDETLFSVPIDEVDRIIPAIKEAEELTNQDLGWSVKVRFGCAIGTNFYEAK